MKSKLSLNPSFYRRLLAMSMPIALQNLVTFSLSLIDTFMVSQVGNTEMAAVTAANAPSFVLLSIIFGLQSGLGILVSQYWGKKDMKNISRALGVGLILGSVIFFIISIIMFLFPYQIMSLLSNSEEIAVLGTPYMRIIGFSYFFNMISSIYVSAQRSIENPSFGMKLYLVSTLLNTFLNYLLIFGHMGCPRMGVEGAALATLIARIVEAAICIINALHNRVLQIDLSAIIRPGREMLQKFIKYSMPVLINETLWGLGNSLMTIILGYTANSVEFLAAYSVTGNLSRIFLVVNFGLGSAAGVIIGKTIGEGSSHEETLRQSNSILLFSVIVGVLLGSLSLVLVPLVFQPYVFPLFKLYGETALIARALAVMSSIALPMHAYSITAVVGILRAGGDVTWALILDVLPQWIFSLVLTALTSLVLHTNAWWIALAIQSESFFKVPLCYWRVRDSRWIHDVTISSEETI